MESWNGQSLLARQSNISRNIDAGISVDLLLFGENLVEKAFEEAIEEVRGNSDSQVLFIGAGYIVYILWLTKFKVL